jgi:hypothetical protein
MIDWDKPVRWSDGTPATVSDINNRTVRSPACPANWPTGCNKPNEYAVRMNDDGTISYFGTYGNAYLENIPPAELSPVAQELQRVVDRLTKSLDDNRDSLDAHRKSRDNLNTIIKQLELEVERDLLTHNELKTIIDRG